MTNYINHPGAQATLADMKAKMLEVMDGVGDNLDIRDVAKLRTELGSQTAVVNPFEGGARPSSAAVGNVIWEEDFDSKAAGNNKAISEVRGYGFEYYSDLPIQTDSQLSQNSVLFHIRNEGGTDNSLRMAKPQEVPLGRSSVYTFAKNFNPPLTGKLAFEMKINIDNFPPGQAAYEGKEDMSAERWIFLSDKVITDNSNPKGKGIAFAFTGTGQKSQIESESGEMPFSVKSWYDLRVNVDTAAGMYEVTVNGQQLQPPTKANRENNARQAKNVERRRFPNMKTSV